MAAALASNCRATSSVRRVAMIPEPITPIRRKAVPSSSASSSRRFMGRDGTRYPPVPERGWYSSGFCVTARGANGGGWYAPGAIRERDHTDTLHLTGYMNNIPVPSESCNDFHQTVIDQCNGGRVVAKSDPVTIDWSNPRK